MEVAGEAYLFNLSLLAVTFAAVSVLVMLIRQTIGGKLSGFDIYLITSYVAHGFVIAICAVLPSLAAGFAPSPAVYWPLSSGAATILLGYNMAQTLLQRVRSADRKLPVFLILAFSLHWLAVASLAANAVVPALRGPALFKGALTLSLAVIMWAFVRRIASLATGRPIDDWDPKRS